MTREEIHNILINATDFVFKDAKIESCSTNIDLLAHNLYIEVNKHEANTLKEFVEWYKTLLEKDYDDKSKMQQKELEIEDNIYFYYGQCTAISRLITLLDQDLEKFLEERK